MLNYQKLSNELMVLFKYAQDAATNPKEQGEVATAYAELRRLIEITMPYELATLKAGIEVYDAKTKNLCEIEKVDSSTFILLIRPHDTIETIETVYEPFRFFNNCLYAVE